MRAKALAEAEAAAEAEAQRLAIEKAVKEALSGSKEGEALSGSKEGEALRAALPPLGDEAAPPPPAAAAADGERTSEGHRARGNALFGEANYGAAAEAYGLALSAALAEGSRSQADAARILANRAACHLKVRPRA